MTREVYAYKLPLVSRDHLLTVEEVASYLKVRKRTIYSWLKKGKIPAFKAVGQWRFRKKEIDDWLKSKG